MARPPEASLPEVLPTENVPAPYQRLQTPVVPARQYDQSLAGSLEQAGQRLGTLGEHWGRIAADDVTNQWMEKAEKILHGDPNAKNPDGTPDLGYMGLRGENALRERPAYEKRFDDLTKEARSKLVTPDQKAAFDQMTRRQRAVYGGQMGTHADTQSLRYGDSVYTNQIKTGLDGVAADPLNNASVGLHSARVIDGFVKKFQMSGLSPEEGVREAHQAIAISRIMSIGVKDKALAGQIADHEKAVLGTKYAEIKRHFEAEEETEGAMKFATDAATSVGLGGATATGVAPRPNAPLPGSRSPGGLSPDMEGVRSDLFDKMKKEGIDLSVSSGRRPGGGRSGGIGRSRHETGDAIDVPLPAGKYTEDQLKKIVTEALKDPRIKGFEYDPTPGNEHFHFDVRGPNEPRAAFGHNGRSDTVGKNWPAWMTTQVQQWAGERPPLLTSNMANADAALHLTPQEKNLYQQHLDNLGKGGIVNSDRSVSTLLQTVEEHNGRYYNVPTIWQNEMLWDDKEDKPDRGKIRAEVEKVGWDKFPSYATPQEADARYQQMHEFMDRDTQMPPTLAQTAKSQQADVLRRRAYAMDKVFNSSLSHKQKVQALSVLQQMATSDQLKIAADEKEKQDANDQASDFYTKLIATPGMHPNILQAISQDPRLQPHSRVQMMELVRKYSADPQGVHARDFGPQFDDVTRRMTLKAGDPQRISDASQLLQLLASNGLTLPGYHQAAGILATVKKENDYGVVDMTNEFKKRAHDMLSYHGTGGDTELHIAGLKDFKGETAYAVQFLPQLYRDFAKWREDPKNNPGDFFTDQRLQDMTRRIRTPEEMTKDRLKAMGQSPDEPIPPPPSGANAEGWTLIMKNPPTYAPDGPLAPTIWATALQRLLGNDSPEYDAAFDRRFAPASGWTAKEVRRLLKPPQGAPAPLRRQPSPPLTPHGTTFLPGVVPERVPPPPPEERP